MVVRTNLRGVPPTARMGDGHELTDRELEDVDYWRKRAGWFDDDESMKEYNQGVYDSYYSVDDAYQAEWEANQADVGSGGKVGTGGANDNTGTILKILAAAIAVCLAIVLFRAYQRRTQKNEDRVKLKEKSSRASRSKSRSDRSRSSGRSRSRSKKSRSSGSDYNLMDDDGGSRRSSRSKRSRSKSKSSRDKKRSSSRSRSRKESSSSKDKKHSSSNNADNNENADTSNIGSDAAAVGTPSSNAADDGKNNQLV